jgi:Protein of unknown function (DUF4240)
MNENRFWSMIERAWNTAGGFKEQRARLAKGKVSEDEADELAEAVNEMAESLREQLSELNQEDLLEFDRILERKLYDIDRAEIQEHTDGSDDGFLYARGFIVAAGKDYYEAVTAKPSVATMDLECEDMCYLSFHVYEERFGEMPHSGISRESCSNKAGWPNL